MITLNRIPQVLCILEISWAKFAVYWPRPFRLRFRNVTHTSLTMVQLSLLFSAVLLTSVAALACPFTKLEYEATFNHLSNCGLSISVCENTVVTGNGPSGTCCFYVKGVLVSGTEAIFSYDAGESVGIGSTLCLIPDQSNPISSPDNRGRSTTIGPPSTVSPTSAIGQPSAGRSTSAIGQPSTGSSPNTADSTDTGSSPSAISPSSAGGSFTTSRVGGCIGLSTTCNGSRVFDIVRQKYSFVHRGRTMTRDVLCIDTNSSQICLTPTHILTLAGQSQTMNELCRKRECSKRRERVFNFWAQNPDEEIECGLFGITQKVDNRVLAAFSAMNNIVLMPTMNWALLRIFHL
jgi:hypothetical protein